MAKLKPGEELQLEIDDLVYGGKGLGRIDGYVVFTNSAVPGDVLKVRIKKAKRDYAEAVTLDVLEAGPERIKPIADHPGAPWQILQYQSQLKYKQQQIEHALRRIAKSEVAVSPIIPAKKQWRYRNKLEYSFGEGQNGQLICGFHKSGTWETIEHVDDCLLATERNNQVRNKILEWCRDQGLTPYDRRSHEGLLRNLVIREADFTDDIQARIITSQSPQQIPYQQLKEILPEISLFHTSTDAVSENTIEGETKLIYGNEKYRESLMGLDFLVSPFAFMQTNGEMVQVLYQKALEEAELDPSKKVYDIFCGTGTISLLLAKQVDHVWGIELVPEAIADAIENAEINNISNVSFISGDARKEIRPLLTQTGSPDLCVIDPPRAGMSQKVVRRVIEANPQRIVYISCNPTTFAANAAQFSDAGYRLTKVQPVDMFPQTPHIELVATLLSA